MVTAELTSRGQLTIPKQVRDKLGISPGEELVFEEKDSRFFFIHIE
jgi:AbrB family looped-hinge helix DNA binding protein